ncbi:MAG: c-type cytochrome [Hydrogenophilales bacterium]|nr:c-type cytochrome [Hydrogenophilales bacterium]
MTKHILPAILLALLVAACSKAPEPAKEAAPAATPQAAGNPAAGKSLAETKCANCHGLDGKGTAADIPNLAGQKAAYMQLAMQEYKAGKRAHAALQQLGMELSDAQLADITAYYAGLPAIKPASAAPADTGKQATAACAACHGADGNSSMAGTPSLAGQHAGYLVAALQAYKSGARKDATMAPQAAKLDAATIATIAAYYSTQTGKPRGAPAGANASAGEPLSGKCGGCHGGKGQSADAKFPSLAGQDHQYLAKSIKAYATGARANAEMKASVAGMKPQDIDSVAAFYASQEPKATTSKSMTAADWAARCDKCHAAGAENPAMVVPHIQGQQADYIDHALKAYRDGKRQQSAMHVMGVPLTDADIRIIADHYSALAPR